MASPLISICIPAYKRIDYLKRLLDSISQQSFQNYEVIITDDTPDRSVRTYIESQSFSFELKYIQNLQSKGTPQNWMEGIQYASGEWIKIMHDDDWLTNKDSMREFVSAICPEADCIFSGYVAAYEEQNRKVDKTISNSEFQKVKKDPYRLFASNVIGPPSVVLFRKNMHERYDPNLKWLVDLEAYIRMLKNYNCFYISRPLITMSYNQTQVTNDCFRNPDVEIPEALYYYQKHGSAVHHSLFAYDGWWRLFRNLDIRRPEQMNLYTSVKEIPAFIRHILSFHNMIPAFLLRWGPFSKVYMFLSYLLKNFRGIRHHH
jgi:glycosyltransferase involved in cell wall biosynthesis